MSSSISITTTQEQRKIRNDKYYKNNGGLLHKIKYLQKHHTFSNEISNLPTITIEEKQLKYKEMLHYITQIKLTALGIV